MNEEQLAGLVRALQRQGRQTVLFHQALAERVGLNATDSRTLAYLMDVGSATAGQLAEMTGLTTGAVTHIVDRLERAGFVRRHADPDDRRRVLVEPLPGGPADRKMRKLFESLGMAVAKMLEKYDEDELEVIRRFSEESAEVMRRETEKLHR